MVEAFSASQPLKILAVVPSIIPSTAIAVEQPLKYLAREGVLTYTVQREEETNRGDIERCDIAFFYRNVEPLALCLFKFAKRIGRKLIYGLDDDFFNIPPITRVGRYYRRRMNQVALRKFVEEAEIVLVHSDSIANYVRSLNQNIAVWKDLHFDFSILEDPFLRREVHDDIRIGYAGTTTHDEDFSPLIPAIKRIGQEYGDKVSFEFLGFVPEELRPYAHAFKEWITDYPGFIKAMYSTGWDIGLAPLADTLSNRGKTNNKCREYGACQIAGIYSDMPVYRPFIRHGENGMLAPHTEDGWYENMKILIESAELRKKIAANAYEFAKLTYQLGRTANFYLAVLFDISDRAEKKPARWPRIICNLENGLALGHKYLDILHRLLGNDSETRRAVVQILRNHLRAGTMTAP